VNDTRLFLAVGMPTLVVLTGILIDHWQVSDINARITDSNARIADLRQDMRVRFREMTPRFGDLKDTWRAVLRRVEQVIDARLKHLEER